MMVVLAAVLGCADSPEPSLEVTLDPGAERASFATPDGSVTAHVGDHSPPPAGFPSDVPLPDGVNWVTTGALPSKTVPGAQDYTMVGTSSRSRDDLVAWGRRAIGAPWVPRADRELNGAWTLTFRDADESRSLIVQVREHGAETQVTVAVYALE